MKIRNGFVSNSSSSSFIVTIKSDQKMSKEILMTLFDLKENSILFNFANELSNWMLKNLKELDIKGIHNNYCGSDEKMSDEEMIDEIVDQGYPDISKEDLLKISNKEYHYYEGSASDDSGNGLESYLCESGINVNNDFIHIQSGGDY